MRHDLITRFGLCLEVEFAEGHPRPVIINHTNRVKYHNIHAYEWTRDELILFAGKDSVRIPILSVAYIIVEQPQPESEG